MLVVLDLGVDLVESGVGGVFSTGDPDVYQPLLVQIVAKDMGWIGKQLKVNVPLHHCPVHNILRLSTNPKYPHILGLYLLPEFIELCKVGLAVGSPEPSVVD